ncbi:MAG: PQQ-binding-like beta-propeller repeat protein [Phycisphaerae bacterium]|nr:PQQ-binding-like beta-propeller repeat protein [Phycisphaerae bacterium]
MGRQRPRAVPGDFTGEEIMRSRVWFALALMFLVHGVSRGEDWPMWGHDPARSGRTAMKLPEILHPQWIRRLPAPRRAWIKQLDDRDKLEFDLSYSPIVMDNIVFVPSMNSDSLTAYDLDSGKEKWRFYADGPVRVAPAAGNGKVYFVSDDGRMYCLDAETGKERWRFDAKPTDHKVLGNGRVISMWPARGGPVLYEGKIYFAAGVWPYLGTFVFALDAETGKQIWANTGHSTDWQSQPHGGAFAFAGVSPQGYLAVGGDRLVVSGGRALPAMFDRRDGTLLLSSVDGKEVGGYRVRIDGNYCYNHGLRFRLSDGQRDGDGSIVDKTLLARVNSLRKQFDGDVFEYAAAGGRLLVVTHKGTIYCFGPDKRKVKKYAYRLAKPSVRSDAAGDRAKDILTKSGLREGYALCLGVGDGSLMEQLSAGSKLHIVGIDADPKRIDALRRRFDDAGLYGRRIALIPGTPGESHYPKYISSLVVLEDPSVLTDKPDAALLETVYDLLRPYNGRAFLKITPGTREAFAEALKEFTPVNGLAEEKDGYVVLSRTGPLPDTGQWTHQYADSANTVISHDDLVRPPFGPIWFGGISNEHVLPRHALGPRPQVAGGRLVILGVETISARCVFTGRELWVREFAGVGHPFTDMNLERDWRRGKSVYMVCQPGAAYIGSPYVTLPDDVYLRYKGCVYRLDPETGKTRNQWKLPARPDRDKGPDWGHISVCGDVLITTTNPHIWRGGALGAANDDRWDGSSSERLIAMDRNTGKVLWTRDAQIGFRHMAITSGDGKVFINDLLSEKALDLAKRRGTDVTKKPRLYALDLQTGEVLWTVESDVFGTFLGYNKRHDILIEGGSRDTRRPLEDEPGVLIARRGKDGEILWRHNGDGLQGPMIQHDEMLISGRPGSAIRIPDGKTQQREHPITGREIDWSYWKAYGCGMSNAGTHLILFRSGAAGFADMENGVGTSNLGGAKSGCTASLIPADGILNAPDYTRTCTCSYQNQTSQGLIHMPEMEMWTLNEPLGRVDGPIVRMGVNLGAPGDRMHNGTLWTPFPRSGAPGLAQWVVLNSVDYKDVPVRVVSTAADRPSGFDRNNTPENTLDGNPSTSWEVQSDHKGRFNAWIRYELNDPVALKQMRIAWSGPKATRLRIETSLDDKKWTTAAEHTGTGRGKKLDVVRFDPVRAKFIRVSLGEHGDMEVDDKKQRVAKTARISRVRIGTLPFPDAYGFYMPKDVFRRHSLFVDASEGLNWVSASGVRGIRYFELPGVQGNNQPYTVDLHFAEPDEIKPSQRVFDISIQGKSVAKEFDIVREAGGPNRAIVRSFPNIPIGESLRIELTPAAGSKYPPVLCGVELRKEP